LIATKRIEKPNIYVRFLCFWKKGLVLHSAQFVAAREEFFMLRSGRRW
jgi:hypothetical protein